MKRLTVFISLITICLLSACSSKSEISLLDVSSDVITRESIVAEDNNKKVGSIISAELEYKFVFKTPKIDVQNGGKIPYEFDVETPILDEFRNVKGGASFKIGSGSEIDINKPGILNYHVRYELARKGTGIEEGKYEEYHFPNEEEIKEVKKNALKNAILVIKKDSNEIKRFNLWEFKKD